MTSNDLPITALCVVTDKSKCPFNYTPIWKSYDSSVETDLWKDSLFGKKINRFICYTKDYPINDTYNVIEDIKLLNERENMIGGFVPVDKCFDNNSEKSFQKKVLCIKVSHRFYTPTAVSDIIILVRTKRPPIGYSLIGEINSHTICVKFSPVNPAPSRPPGPPQQINQSLPSSMSANVFPSAFSSTPPPIPPRPASISNALNDRLSNVAIEQSYVLVDQNVNDRQVNGGSNQSEFMYTMGRHLSQTSQYNPLQGVPFEINPIYDNSRTKENLDLNSLKHTLNKPNDLINQLWYDFNLENTYLQQNEM